MIIRECTDTNDSDWLELRREFIPELGLQEQADFLQAFAHQSAGFVAFIASDEQGSSSGLAEVSIRTDFVNGCRHRPVLYLEGIYVRPELRGQGVARAICAAAEDWGRAQGCREFASDVYLDDHRSLAAHAGLGFVEMERVACLCKPLFPD